MLKEHVIQQTRPLRLMSFDSSSMDLGLRLASCLCEVGTGGTFCVKHNWGTFPMRKMGFGMSFGKAMNSWGFLRMLRNTLGKTGRITIHAMLSRRTRGFWLTRIQTKPIILMDKNPPPVDMENIPVFVGFYTGDIVKLISLLYLFVLHLLEVQEDM